MKYTLIVLCMCFVGCAGTRQYSHAPCIDRIITLERDLRDYERLTRQMSDRVKELEARLDERRKADRQETDRISENSRILYMTLPSPAPKEPEYVTVKRGDSFWLIAYMRGINGWDFIRANPRFDIRKADGIINKARRDDGWDPDYLKVGDRLQLP